MCLITEKTKPVILKKDKKVFKLVTYYNDNHVVSSMRNFHYELNQLYERKLTPCSGKGTAADDPSYNFYYQNENTDWLELITISEGFHFFRTITRIRKISKNRWDFNGAIARCIIPKGATVYYDSTGLGVASQLIIKDVIPLKI